MSELFKLIPANGGGSHQVDVDPFSQLPNKVPEEVSLAADGKDQDDTASPSQPRTRRRLTDYQKQVLEEVFATTPYLTPDQYVEVAWGLGIPKPALQNWFKNKRYRLKIKKETEKRNKAKSVLPAPYIQNSRPQQGIHGEVSSGIYYQQSYNVSENQEDVNSSFFLPAVSSGIYY